MDEVDGAINGVDDPGGTVCQLDAFSSSHRLLPDEPKVRGHVTQLELAATSVISVSVPVLGVAPPNGGDQDLLDPLIRFCHQISWRTFKLHLLLPLECGQNHLPGERST